MKTSGTARVASVEAMVFRAPVAEPVQTSFGLMLDRPMVLVRIVDSEGGSGWGEIWCNFPACGAEHRARLVQTVFAPLLQNQPLGDPAKTWKDLTDRTRVLAIQCGEAGPFAQVIAGIDTALWDLRARRAGLPLWRLLGGADPKIALYASGINPQGPEKLVALRHTEGYRAFKLKIGFGAERDLRNLAEIRAVVGPACPLMVDVNQAWDLPRALIEMPALTAYAPGWVEEPLSADRPWSEWRSLAQRTDLPLAAGENLHGAPAFRRGIKAGVLTVVQPDVAKWGGISGCLPVARAVRQAGLRYCPHYLGGGVGLMASAHLLAAVGGDGMLEVDANENLLRSALAPAIVPGPDARVTLPDVPGLGPEPDLGALRGFLQRH